MDRRYQACKFRLLLLYTKDIQVGAGISVIYLVWSIGRMSMVGFRVCECISRTFLTRIYPPKLG
jgi:hypothetical protein